MIRPILPESAKPAKHTKASAASLKAVAWDSYTPIPLNKRQGIQECNCLIQKVGHRRIIRRSRGEFRYPYRVPEFPVHLEYIIVKISNLISLISISTY